MMKPMRIGEVSKRAQGAALIAILCQSGYDLRSTITQFIIVALAGSCICIGVSSLLQCRVLAAIIWAIVGAIGAAFILLCFLLVGHDF